MFEQYKKFFCHFTVRSGQDRREGAPRRKFRNIDHFRFGGAPRRISGEDRRQSRDRRKNWPISRLEAPLVNEGFLDKEGMFPINPS